MKLTAIKKRRVSQNIVEQIKFAIENEELQPGDKLPSERELAQTFSVSRTAVREAISALESASIIEVRPGIGIFLKPSDHKELMIGIDGILNDGDIKLLELLEMRVGLEGQAAYLAAKRRTDKQLQKIKAAYDALEASALSHHVAAQEDYLFHISIVEASHNNLLLEAVKLFSDKFKQGIEDSRSKSMMVPGKSEMVLKEHWNIYQAIESQDPELAQQMMVYHLDSIKDRYAGSFS